MWRPGIRARDRRTGPAGVALPRPLSSHLLTPDYFANQRSAPPRADSVRPACTGWSAPGISSKRQFDCPSVSAATFSGQPAETEAIGGRAVRSDPLTHRDRHQHGDADRSAVLQHVGSGSCRDRTSQRRRGPSSAARSVRWPRQRIWRAGLDQPLRLREVSSNTAWPPEPERLVREARRRAGDGPHDPIVRHPRPSE